MFESIGRSMKALKSLGHYDQYYHVWYRKTFQRPRRKKKGGRR